MRRAKTSVLWTLGALLLSTLAAVIFLATADDDFYRWAMQQAIEGTIDREIRVDESFSFDVGLEPTLIVTDVSIENAPWADKKQMARAARVEVQIELEELFSSASWPLWKPEIRSQPGTPHRSTEQHISCLPPFYAQDQRSSHSE